MGRWTVMLWALGACADPPDIAPLEEAPVDTTETTDTVVDTPQVDTPAPDTADTGDTTVAGPSFDPYGFFVEVWFGYDPVSDSTGLFTFDTVVSRTLYQVFIFDETWDGQYASTADYCVVRFVAQNDQPRATWLSGFAGYTFGFSRPQVVVDGDCDGRLGRSKPRDVEQRVADLRWGNAVQPTLDADVTAALIGAGLTEPDLAQFIGGALLGDLVDVIQPNALLPNGYVQGFVADEQLVVELNTTGEGRPLDASQMVVGGSLQRGVYILDSLGMPWELLSTATGLPLSP